MPFLLIKLLSRQGSGAFFFSEYLYKNTYEKQVAQKQNIASRVLSPEYHLQKNNKGKKDKNPDTSISLAVFNRY